MTTTDSTNRALQRRHLSDHPLAKLTESELRVLINLDRHIGSSLADGLSGPLSDLATLAHHEDNDRDYRQTLGAL